RVRVPRRRHGGDDPLGRLPGERRPDRRPRRQGRGGLAERPREGVPGGRLPREGDLVYRPHRMIGKSYDGTLANGVAATGVRGLETIVPITSISSWYDYSRMNGVKYWTDEQPWLAGYVDTDPPEKCAAVRAELDEGEDDATGDYNAYWKTADYREGTIARASRVRASVFAVHAVNDLNVKADHFAEWWKALARRGVQRKVWLTQRGHVDPFDFRRDHWVATLHRWFDHELHKIRNDVMREPRADIEIGPDQWITQPDWPSPDARDITLRPGEGGVLGLKRAPKGATA